MRQRCSIVSLGFRANSVAKDTPGAEELEQKLVKAEKEVDNLKEEIAEADKNEPMKRER